MREIKFRAWVKDLKIMLDGGITVYWDGKIGMAQDYFEDEIKDKFEIGDDCVQTKDDNQDHVINILTGDDWIWLESEQIEVMQFTGLKDKNGKEIYESDWVKDANGSMGVVEWSDEYWGWRFNIKDFENQGAWQHPMKDGFDGHTLEVIGNVYSNPELIDKTT